METSPTYRITTKSGIVIGDNLPRSAPAIQLHEGTPVVGHMHPKDLSQGGETFVAYPLDKKASIVCKVARIDGMDSTIVDVRFIEWVEPDPLPTEGKPKVSEVAAKQAKEAIEGTKVRRGRERKALS